MRRLLALSCAIVLVDTIFYAALYPLVPYFEDELGLSKSIVGVLSGSYGAGVLVGSVPGGYLASRSGVRITALVGLILMSVTSVMFALADTTWLPVLGSVAATIGLLPAFTAVALAGIAIAVWAAFEPASAPSGDVSLLPALGMLRRPLLLTSLWFIGLSPLLFSALAVLVPLDLHRLGWGVAAVGAVFFLSAIFEAFVHPLLGRWSDRSGYRAPVFVGLLASIGILLLLTWVGNPWVIGLLVVLAAGAFNATLVPGTALFSRGTEKAGMDRAVAFAITNFAWASGYAVGAPVGGFLADLKGDALSYLVLTVVCLLTIVLVRRIA
jgi:MFS family permease